MMAAVTASAPQETTSETLGQDIHNVTSTSTTTTEEPFAEPVPNWKEAKIEWGAAWEVHIYTLGALFALIALISIVNVIRLLLMQRLKSKAFFIAMNTLMFIMGLFRTCYFFVDAYNSNNSFPAALAYFSISVTLPCLTSAFILLFVMLTKLLSFKLASPKIVNGRVIITVIVFNFVLAITADLVTGYHFEARAILVVCQATYVLIGIVTSLAYIVLFRKLYNITIRDRKTVIRMSLTSQTPLAKPGKKRDSHIPQPKKTMALKVALAGAVLYFCIALMNLWGIASEFGLYTNKTPLPWPWWGYHFATRLLEVAMGFTILLVASQPFRKKKQESMKSRISVVSAAS
ncbi:proline-rich transmembrane protein 4-like [Lingula anatina]|uniref:Proline-rich transmembrane protein 4-like n=1 Tax=Lingula anatina TaxID=7574 RepID=A0A1S3KCP4_LINAN|nr:proline-rich transmembrane protein 4-like [Lingula anatina]|eukprot:XP_013420026.1 proline-rich transmembrane protein 4-like [Lingula anatina]